LQIQLRFWPHKRRSHPYGCKTIGI